MTAFYVHSVTETVAWYCSSVRYGRFGRIVSRSRCCVEKLCRNFPRNRLRWHSCDTAGRCCDITAATFDRYEHPGQSRQPVAFVGTRPPIAILAPNAYRPRMTTPRPAPAHRYAGGQSGWTPALESSGLFFNPFDDRLWGYPEGTVDGPQAHPVLVGTEHLLNQRRGMLTTIRVKPKLITTPLASILLNPFRILAVLDDVIAFALWTFYYDIDHSQLTA